MNLTAEVVQTPFWTELSEGTKESTVVGALAGHLEALGVEEAFGVSGGAIALFFDQIILSSIELRHFRHESASAFAAIEASFATDKPVVVFSTTGPGLMNTLPAMKAAQADGARIILISGSTGDNQRGRWATQETSSYTLPSDLLHTPGGAFDYAVRVEDAGELPEVLRRLQEGLLRPEGFVAHVSIPMALWNHRLDLPTRPPHLSSVPSAPAPMGAEMLVDLLALKDKEAEPRFAIWVGHGARGASPQVRALAERTGAAVFATPRGKGIFPEKHPRFVGVTGLGGHEEVAQFVKSRALDWILVLGSRLGELSTLWDEALRPRRGLIHVDLDPSVPGSAFPGFPTIGVRAEIGELLDALLALCPRTDGDLVPLEAWARTAASETRSGTTREQTLINAIQRVVVEESDAVVMGDGGEITALLNHNLKFSQPRRYRTAPLFAARGHFCAGVVGAAIARRGKAVAIVGEEAMALMAGEVSVAVQYQAPVVWLVLNRNGHGESYNQHAALGLSTEHLQLPEVDQVAMARAFGAHGLAVASEEDLDGVLQEAMTLEGPVVVDVRMA